MICVNLICVGNLKEKFSRDEQAEYLKRLSAFCKINVVELKEQNMFEDKKVILEREEKQILASLEKFKGYSILCEINSAQKTSEEFAQKINAVSLGHSTLNFIIGGSYGVSDAVKKACDEKISFSKMTFPHNLFRIMLLEQIYRAFTILNNKTYHK